MTGNGFKLERSRFILVVQMVEHWSGVLREATEAPSLDIFKARLKVTVSSLIYTPAHCCRVGLCDLWWSVQPETILWFIKIVMKLPHELMCWEFIFCVLVRIYFVCLVVFFYFPLFLQQIALSTGISSPLRCVSMTPTFYICEGFKFRVSNSR